MNKYTSEFKIGLIAIFTIVILVWGINFLKGNNMFSSSLTFYSIYSEIDGLDVSAPVRINGLNVGRVSEIYFHENNSGQIIVKFILTNNFKLPKNTIARIYNADIMGTKAMQLDLGSSNVFLTSGDTLISEVEVGLKEEVNKQVQPLKNKAEDLISSIDSVMTVITTVLDKNARTSLANSLQSLNRTFFTMELAMVKLDSVIYKNDKRVSNILLNVESISTNLHNSNDELTNVIRNFSEVSDSLAKSNIKSTINNLNNSIVDFNHILSKIENGEGSIGMLINDKELYNNLAGASSQLDLLLKDMRDNPKRYVSFSLISGTSKNKAKPTNFNNSPLNK